MLASVIPCLERSRSVPRKMQTEATERRVLTAFRRAQKEVLLADERAVGVRGVGVGDDGRRGDRCLCADARDAALFDEDALHRGVAEQRASVLLDGCDKGVAEAPAPPTGK